MHLSLEYEAFQAGRKRVVNVRQCTKNDQTLTKYLRDLKILRARLRPVNPTLLVTNAGVAGTKRKIVHKAKLKVIVPKTGTTTTNRGGSGWGLLIENNGHF